MKIISYNHCESLISMGSALQRACRKDTELKL